MATNTKAPNHIEFAGDYNNEHIFLHTHYGEIIDIKNMVDELNIYESIYKNALTGSVVMTDAQNLISKLQIQGMERLSFKIATPGVTRSRDAVDATEGTGRRMGERVVEGLGTTWGRVWGSG